MQMLKALPLEVRVAARQHLIDQGNLGIEVHSDGKRQSHVHPRREVLDRRLQEIGELTEFDDRVVVPVDLAPAESEQSPVQIHVLPPGVLGMEARTKFQQRRDTAADLNAAKVRPENPCQHLEQGALARSVVPDNAEELASGHVEADIAERPKVLPVTTAALSDDLLERLMAAPVNTVPLRESLHPDDPLGHLDFLREVALETAKDEPSQTQGHHRDSRESEDSSRVGPAVPVPDVLVAADQPLHRIELQESVQVPVSDRAERIDDRSAEEEHGEEQRDDVLEISEVDHQRGKKQTDPRSQYQLEDDQQGQGEQRRSQRLVESECEAEKDSEAEEHVHKAGQDRGERKELAWEVDTPDQVCIPHDGLARSRDGDSERVPWQHPAQQEDGIAVERNARYHREHDRVQNHQQQWIQERPEKAERGALVLGFQVLLHQKEQQVSVTHKSSQLGRQARRAAGAQDDG